LYALIEATEVLTNIQKEILINLLVKYIRHMTSKRAVLRVFEYEF
jgi:hypothetical protein